MTKKLAPIEEPYPEAVSAILPKYPEINGYLLTLFRTFANSPRFLEKGVPNLLDDQSPLPLRIREIVILRVTANKKCEYEWGIHVTVFGLAAEFSKAQIKDTATTRIDHTLWSDDEINLLEAIDQICDEGRIDQSTHEQFQRRWTAVQQLEILALCGTYHTVCFVANIADLPLESFAARFPSE